MKPYSRYLKFLNYLRKLKLCRNKNILIKAFITKENVSKLAFVISVRIQNKMLKLQEYECVTLFHIESNELGLGDYSSKTGG